MEWSCHVCGRPIDPHGEEDRRIRVEGVTELPGGMAWVWGPVPVHDDCRYKLTTPYDDKIGDGYQSTWQKLAP